MRRYAALAAMQARATLIYRLDYLVGRALPRRSATR
jgi:hypothetical protein